MVLLERWGRNDKKADAARRLSCITKALDADHLHQFSH